MNLTTIGLKGISYLKPAVAIEPFLKQQLRQSLQALSVNIPVNIKIPLHFLPSHVPITYRCAIALRLAKPCQQLPLTLATQIQLQLQQQLVHHWTIQVIPPGKIQFELTDIGLAQWLQQTLESPFLLTSTQLPQAFPEPLFPIQYSHARCCALLRLAQSDDLLSVQPQPIPWLNARQELQLTHPAEQGLIAQWVATLDTCDADLPNTPWLEIAQHLSQRFQIFYRDCRIWGRVKTATPELAQARLGLVKITQWMLQFLLQNKLGIIAPIEL